VREDVDARRDPECRPHLHEHPCLWQREGAVDVEDYAGEGGGGGGRRGGRERGEAEARWGHGGCEAAEVLADGEVLHVWRLMSRDWVEQMWYRR